MKFLLFFGKKITLIYCFFENTFSIMGIELRIAILPADNSDGNYSKSGGFNMTRSQMITKIARQTNISAAQVEAILDTFVDNIVISLKEGDKVTIAGFGRFEMRERKTKAYTNPKTKKASRLAPTSIPGFKASGLLKQRIANKR